MATTTELQAQLEELRKVRASGTLKVEFSDRSLTYKSDAELLTAINDIERRIAGAGGNRPRTVLIHTSKGF